MEQLQGIDLIHARNWVATDTDTSRLTQAQFGGLCHGFVSQSTRTRNNTNAAWSVNVTWHNADFTFTWGNHTWAVRANHASAIAISFQIAFGFQHIDGRHAFGNHHNQAHTRIHCFHNRIQHKRSRYVNHRSICTCFFNRFFHGIENRQIQMFLAAFTWRHTTNDFGAVSQGLFRVKSTVFTSETLYQYFGIFINQYAHSFTPYALTASTIF